jgi:2-polyprenyl-6-methoxyphenol hydroxylase-like FAD-dependent oxidoreductase
MADILVVGGGLVGHCAAMLLARDGHAVTVLERDPAPPPASVDATWDSWTRRGVNQFHMIHYFLPRFREIVERELPEVAVALDADGALRFNPLEAVPEAISGGLRDGDERFQSLTGRRPMVEAAVERVAATTPGVTVHRGVAVRGLLVGDRRGSAPPHVVGVVTDDGTEHRADLVVDAGGRRSAMPTWVAALGAPAIDEERDDCGFVYFARHFRSPDGSLPPLFGPPLQAYDSVSTLTLPADNGTWGVGLITSAHDAVMRPCRDVDRWTEVLNAFPLIAHWIDAEPISDVAVMAGIEDRRRSYVVGGVPVVTGIAAVGDAWACTNPSLGRGASLGVAHAEALRDVVRRHPLDDHEGFALAWDDETRTRVQPFVRDTLHFDRHRLAEIDAHCEGRPYETDDEEWQLGQAFAAASGGDPDVFRAFLEMISLYERGTDVLARPGMTERVQELAGPDPGASALPGPNRAELLAILAS